MIANNEQQSQTIGSGALTFPANKVFAVADDKAQAEKALERLRTAGVAGWEAGHGGIDLRRSLVFRRNESSHEPPTPPPR